MSTVIPPRNIPKVSHTQVSARPRDPAEKNNGGFDQHFEAAQRAATKEPVPVSTPVADTRNRGSDPSAQVPVKHSTPDTKAKTAPPAAASTTSSSATAAAPKSGHTVGSPADADAGDSDADDSATPADPALSASLWGFFGVAATANASVGPVSGGTSAADASATDTGAGAVAGAGNGLLPGNSLLQTPASPNSPEGGLTTLLADGAMPAVAASAIASHSGTDKDPLADLTQSVALLTPPSAAPLTVHALQLPAPVGGQAFQQALGQQVVWLSGQEIKQASIRLHPQDLGQLDVKVSVNQGRVDVVFNAQHPAAANAVQQTLPQLANMLAQHGLALGQADVGHRQSSNSQSPDSQRGRANAVGSSTSDANTAVGPMSSIGTVNLLDAFA